MGCMCHSVQEVVTEQFLVFSSVKESIDFLSVSSNYVNIVPLMGGGFVHDEKEQEYWLADGKGGDEQYITNR